MFDPLHLDTSDFGTTAKIIPWDAVQSFRNTSDLAEDPTFSAHSAFGSVTWVAQRLGMSKSAFLRKKPLLEREGFPAVDALIKLYLKDDVDAWIAGRRRIRDANSLAVSSSDCTTEVNFNAI
ncbi:MAG: hypothetical protein RIG84_04865 [Roseovarius sp.]